MNLYFKLNFTIITIYPHRFLHHSAFGRLPTNFHRHILLRRCGRICSARTTSIIRSLHHSLHMGFAQIPSADPQTFDQHGHQTDANHLIDRVVVVPEILQSNQNRCQDRVAFRVLCDVHDTREGATDADLCAITGIAGE